MGHIPCRPSPSYTQHHPSNSPGSGHVVGRGDQQHLLHTSLRRRVFIGNGANSGQAKLGKFKRAVEEIQYRLYVSTILSERANSQMSNSLRSHSWAEACQRDHQLYETKRCASPSETRKPWDILRHLSPDQIGITFAWQTWQWKNAPGLYPHTICISKNLPVESIVIIVEIFWGGFLHCHFVKFYYPLVI